ncbi:hypothetical protein FSARC_10113 [Fusarium sarcochroum]|uniref:Uncharacterized protein n=1 Tax=Fusarium sarcochroum TaxID=1208366 RepID=A0A8H4X4I3_9HYPO|nr:hypothetical protein FSARC_10113 [Fusarium sarcochroum]
MPNPLKAIHASYHLLTWALDHGQVPNDIRRSLELVRTCDSDLQHLIELRNDCLPLLERRPKILQRVHSIIESAQKGLQEVCEIVERCRPEVDRGGRTSFSRRMAWLLVDSSEFRSQEPIVSRHHAAVLAELNFLRQIALLAPIPEPEKVQEKLGVQEDAKVFDNVALLGDMFGDLTTMSAPVKKQHPIPQPMATAPPIIVFNANTEPTAPSVMSSLLLPPSLNRSASSQTLHIEHAVDSLPEVLPVNMANVTPSRSHTTESKYNTEELAGLALLLGDPLDLQNCPSPLQSSKTAALPVVYPSHAPTTGLPRPQSTHNDSNQYLPLYHANDSVSDLSQNSRHASVSYTPSVLSSHVSNPHQNHRSSLSALPTITRTFTQHHNVSSRGQLTWSNSSSTTLSSISPEFTGFNPAWAQPIAELDSSPYQMVPIISALNQRDHLGDGSMEQKLAVQINTIPVELPAEDSPAAKTSLRRQSTHLRSSRRVRALNHPASSLSQQLKQQSSPDQDSTHPSQGNESQT